MDPRTSDEKHGDGGVEPPSPRRPAWCRSGRLATASRVGIAAAALWACVGGGVAAASVPVTTLAGGPTGYVTTTSASFSFSSKWLTATFRCHLDTAGYTPCTSPITYSRLPIGPHTFSVYATTSSGVAGLPVQRTWTVTVPAPPPPPATGGSLIWSGDLSTGNLSQYNIQACPGPAPPKGVTLVNSPVHPGWPHSMQFAVDDLSVHANCPILGSPGNPSAGAFTPGLFTPGQDVYIGFGTFFPQGFPSICTPWVTGCFMQIAELYGLPFRGSSPVSVMVIRQKLVLSTQHSGSIWTAPTSIPYGTAWQDLVLHIHLDTTAATGFVELFYNGVQQIFTNGYTRYNEATLDPGVNWDGIHPDYFDIDQYRGGTPSLGLTTLYHTGIKVGTSYAAAAP